MLLTLIMGLFLQPMCKNTLHHILCLMFVLQVLIRKIAQRGVVGFEKGFKTWRGYSLRIDRCHVITFQKYTF